MFWVIILHTKTNAVRVAGESKGKSGIREKCEARKKEQVENT